MRTSVAIRARVISIAFIVVAVLLVARLYLVQVVHGAKYREDAASQYSVHDEGVIDRGSIFFTSRDGQLVAAAVMLSGWRIAIQPRSISNASRVYSQLNSIVSIDRERFFDAAAKLDDPYEEIADRVGDDQAALARKMKIPGVLLVSDHWRTYPAHELASQVVGFVGYQSTARVGVYGLERQYEETLAHYSTGLYVNPFAEIFSNVQSLLSFGPSGQKGSIITTIEPRVQQQLETTLEGVMKQYTPEFAGGIVMDPRTGDIIAMAGSPSFDPNTYNLAEFGDYQNRLVEGRYELGSIMKPLTVAAGIESGAITATSTYNDVGCMTVSTYEICNYDKKARGAVEVQQILSQSLNIGAATVATKTGYSRFTQFLRALGFAQNTGIDLPNEQHGDLRTLGFGQEPAINYDTAAYGQGISVTPIEMIRALSALGTGGMLPNPHVVTAVRFENGITRAESVPANVRVMKPSTAEAVTEMLIKVFDTGLLKGELKQEHYTIAAKTGTAQIPDGTGGYYPPGTYLHSFFGYFPARDPRFIIFLFAQKPHGQEYASATLARPFMDIAKFLINYYAIPPDR